MAFSNDIVAGIAQLLEDAGVGTWQTSGVYASGTDRPIFTQEPPDDIHRVIVVAHYPVTQYARTRDSVEGVQVRNRGTVGDPRPANDDADAIRATLDGLQHVTLGAVRASLIEWRSGAPLGQDSTRRWETVQNFHIYTARPGANRED